RSTTAGSAPVTSPSWATADSRSWAASRTSSSATVSTSRSARSTQRWALSGVLQCAGYGVDDPATGERLAMAVRLGPGAGLTFDAMVEGLIEAGLAKWKIPEELVVWDTAFPETASGKVQRNLLDEQGADRPRSVAARLR